MNSILEKRKLIIINAAYFALIAAGLFIVGKYFLPLLVPFIFAFFFAAALNKPINAIARKTPLRRSMLSVGFVLVFIVVIASVFFLLGMEIFEALSGFYSYVVSQLQNISGIINDLKLWVLDVTVFLPESIRTVLHENVTVFFDNIIQNGFENISIDTSKIDWSTLLSKGGAMLTGTVGKIPSLIVSFLIFLISTVFISSDFDRIKEFFKSQLTKHHAEKLFSAWELSKSSLKKMIKAYCLIILITTFELTVGLYILKFIGVYNNPYIIFIALGIAIIDIIPVLGTGTVLIPWAVISFITENFGMGIGLIVIYVVILVIRQIIEPKLVAGQVGLPPIATIIAMYVGSKTLGILGFFILPFGVILLKVFNDAGIISVFKDRYNESQNENAENSDADVQIPAKESENG